MQPRPALPWSADTERGTIRLNKTVSQQDLLDGILKWTVSDYHGTNLPGVIARTSGNKLVLQDGNGQMMYEIADFSQSTNVLELTRVQGSSESLLSVEFPAVIAPLGDIQLFKDRFGYEYANGSMSTVYARVNNPWASPFSIGNGSVWQNSMAATAPTPQSPNNKYSLSIWVDFTSEEFSSIQAGQIIPCSNATAEDVTNAQKIFNAQNPLPVEGDVQVFADSNQLTIPAGETNKLYVRVNKSWGFGEGWVITGDNGIVCSGPTSEYPDDLYGINVYMDFGSNDSSGPFNEGDIVECSYYENIDVTGKPYVFSKPEQ